MKYYIHMHIPWNQQTSFFAGLTVGVPFSGSNFQNMGPHFACRNHLNDWITSSAWFMFWVGLSLLADLAQTWSTREAPTTKKHAMMRSRSSKLLTCLVAGELSLFVVNGGRKKHKLTSRIGGFTSKTVNWIKKTNTCESILMLSCFFFRGFFLTQMSQDFVYRSWQSLKHSFLKLINLLAPKPCWLHCLTL